MTKGKRRSTKTIPILSPKEMTKICERAENPRDASLVALLYLSGRRIGEILPLKKKDFQIVEHGDKRAMFFTTFNEKSWRREERGIFSIERYVRFKDYEGIVYYEKIEPRFSLTSPSGLELGHYVTDHLKGLDGEDYLFRPYRASSKDHINLSRAYQIVRKLDDRLWLHAMRHINFTRLARVYKDDPTAMHHLTFHKQFKSTLEYIHTEETEERLEQV